MEKKIMYGNKVRALRLLRGFSQEYMADKLEINQTSYSRIENNQQKLTAEMLEKLAGVLGVSVTDITSNEPLIIQNNASNYGAQGRIENFYADQKELFERIIASKDDEITNLKGVIDSLKDVIVSFKK